MNEQLNKVLDEFTAFPILPDAAIELIELANSSAFLFKDMVAIMERDPSIAANVMKVANSAEHGRQGHVRSINQASELLNIKELAELVMNSAKASYFSTGAEDGYVYLMRTRDHCVLTGRVARILATEMGGQDKNMLFLAGLIHDVGFILLARHYWDSFSALVSHSFSEDREMWEMEKEKYGVSHAEVGALILEKWNIPQEVCGAVRYHHHPWDDDKTQLFSTIVHFANFLSHYMLDRSAPFELKKKIDQFLHSPGADLVEKYGFALTPENFVKFTEKLDEKTRVAG
ncbi:MAG: HDOD domain-containing protein [Nitrospinota bacterium]|nr:HDOD domain-containing protein [Nitrospinota bacterium]